MSCGHKEDSLFDFSSVKEALSHLQFQSDPGGFVIFEEEAVGGGTTRRQADKENESPKVTFSVEPYWDCRNWDILKAVMSCKRGPHFVIYDMTYTRIEGGNKRLLFMIEWQPKGDSYKTAKVLRQEIPVMFYLTASSVDQLNLQKIKDHASKGAAIGTK